MGPPDRSIDMGGKKGYVYDLTRQYKLTGTYHQQFTYFMVNGVVDDVLYTADGACNGLTAKKVQSTGQSRWTC